MDKVEEVTLPNGQTCCRLPGVHIVLAYKCKECEIDTMSFVKAGESFVPQPCQKCGVMCKEAVMFGIIKDVAILTGHPVIVVTDPDAEKAVEKIFVPEKKLVLPNE